MKRHQVASWLIGGTFPALGWGWGWGVGSGAVAAALVLISPVASAAVLSNWTFDSSSHQLSVTLPQGVTPRFLVFAEPARIVLELPNTQLSGPMTTQQTYGGAVRRIQVIQQTENTVHIVLELAPNTVIDRRHAELTAAAAAGQTRWTLTPLVIDGPAPIAQAPASPPAPATAPTPATPVAPAESSEPAAMPALPPVPETAIAPPSPEIPAAAAVATLPQIPAETVTPPTPTAQVVPPTPSAAPLPTGPRFIETPEGQLSIRAANLMLAAPGDSLSDLPNTLPLDPFQASAAPATHPVSVPPLDGTVAVSPNAPLVSVPPLDSPSTATTARVPGASAAAPGPAMPQPTAGVVSEPPPNSALAAAAPGPSAAVPAAVLPPGETPAADGIIASAPPSVNPPTSAPTTTAPPSMSPPPVAPTATAAAALIEGIEPPSNPAPALPSVPLAPAPAAPDVSPQFLPTLSAPPPTTAPGPAPAVAAPALTEPPPFLAAAPPAETVTSMPPPVVPGGMSAITSNPPAVVLPAAPGTLVQRPPVLTQAPPFMAAPAPPVAQASTAALVEPPPGISAKPPAAPIATAPAEPVPFLNSAPTRAPMIATAPPESAITFGQPLPTAGVKEDLPSFPYITPPGGAVRTLNPDVLIPAGTLLKLRYSGLQPLRIDQHTTVAEGLLLETELRDAKTGALIAPIGSQVSGQFGPDELGQRWVSQALLLPGRQIPLESASAYFAGPPQVSGQSLAVNSGIGALALTVLTGFTGIGLLGGAFLGATTAVGTAPQVIVIEPNQIIEVQVLADVHRSPFQP